MLEESSRLVSFLFCWLIATVSLYLNKWFCRKGSERKAGGFLLSAHSICVFLYAGFATVNFTFITIRFAVYITVCACVCTRVGVCCSMDTVLQDIKNVFPPLLVAMGSSSLILCCCHTMWLHFFQKSLCTVTPPLQFLSNYNVGDSVAEEIDSGHYWYAVEGDSAKIWLE